MLLFQNGICGGGPSERLAVGIVLSDELIDAMHELLELVNEPRRIALSVIKAKKRST